MSSLLSCIRLSIGLLSFGMTATLLAQEQVYVFNASCFAAKLEGMSGVVTMTLRPDLQPAQRARCLNPNGTELGPDAIKVTYTQGTIDAKVAAVQTDVNKIADAAKAAIIKAVADNSVKADQVNDLVKSIEDKLYERVLRRVKADIEARRTGAAQ